MPPVLLLKSIFTASLLVCLIVSKFADSLPLYRMERMFQRLGFTFPRSTQCRGLMKVAKLLKPIIQCMIQEIRSGPSIATDDTILSLQNDIPGRKRVIDARLWIYSGAHQINRHYMCLNSRDHGLSNIRIGFSPDMKAIY